MSAFELDLGISDPLAMSVEEVAYLTRPEREKRVTKLIEQSHDFLDAAIDEYITRTGRMVAAITVGYSGGNDSTTLVHLFRDKVEYAIHANTTIGIEQTREFVRNTCEEWGIHLIERTPPRQEDHYRALVLDRGVGRNGQPLGGFPGPAMHFKMFQRLKERAIESVQADLVINPYKERMICLLGRRRTESQRRSTIGVVDRRGSRVNVSPLINWTKADLNTYRLMFDDVPRNEVSDLIHMSGECLCGSYASPGEREEVSFWFPEPFAFIDELQAELADRDDLPPHRKIWGWGNDPAARVAEKEFLAKFGLKEDEPRVGDMCSSCEDRFLPGMDVVA